MVDYFSQYLSRWQSENKRSREFLLVHRPECCTERSHEIRKYFQAAIGAQRVWRLFNIILSSSCASHITSSFAVISATTNFKHIEKTRSRENWYCYRPLTPRSHFKNMRPSSPSIPERDFTLEALKQSLRLDGRGPLDMRAVSIEFGPELGWVECCLGKTRYVTTFSPFGI